MNNNTIEISEALRELFTAPPRLINLHLDPTDADVLETRS